MSLYIVLILLTRVVGYFVDQEESLVYLGFVFILPDKNRKDTVSASFNCTDTSYMASVSINSDEATLYEVFTPFEGDICAI